MEAAPQTTAPAASQPPAGPRGWFHRVENGLLVFLLAAMTLLPLLEIVLRQFKSGIPGSIAYVQHLTLLLSMIGGAIAARQQRLLSLSSLTNLLKGPWKTSAQVFSTTIAATITGYLCASSVQFVLATREGGTQLADRIPLWIVQGIMPLGFALITLRIAWHATAGWIPRLTTFTLTAAAMAAARWLPFEPSQLTLPFLLLLLAATALGAPVFTTLGGAALILLRHIDLPIASVPVNHYDLSTNFTLPTIPLFTLAGYFLAEGGASKRLVRVFQAIVGPLRGGPAIVVALSCAFFTSFTGASGVTILALGGLLLPVLLNARYSERSALGLLTGAGSLGLLFPPCLPVILYSIIATSAMKNLPLDTGAVYDVGMERMFLGGMLPGFLLVGLTAAWGIWTQPRAEGEPRRFHLAEARAALWDAKWEILIPIVAIFALFSGFATAVEAAAVTALYAFLVETFVYRDLKLLRDVPRVMVECGLLVGGVLLILGVAMGFTNYLVNDQVPERLVDWVTASIKSPWVFLLLLNLFLIIVGCLMDIYSAIVVVVPLIVPIGLKFGIDPVHLGIIFLANLELGYLTPPVGMNLFLSSYRFNKPMGEVTRAALPMLGVLLLGVLLITYIPWLTTWLPSVIRTR